jgi:hypothetical protein
MPGMKMRAYIEILGAKLCTRRELTDNDLEVIGKFTRENIISWLDSRTDPGWIGVLPEEDFRAVCGNIEVPWATKEGFDKYQRVMKLARRVPSSALGS